MSRTNIIDTNVLIVANQNSPQASYQCILNCIELLEKIRDERISIDNRNLIFNEYKKYCDFSGQPNVGDSFFKWLHDNQANTNVCEVVEITDSGDEQIKFNEIPFNDELIGFDPSDQKFLAVALASRFSSTIHNATDSDWAENRDAIASLEVRVNEICT